MLSATSSAGTKRIISSSGDHHPVDHHSWPSSHISIPVMLSHPGDHGAAVIRTIPDHGSHRIIMARQIPAATGWLYRSSSGSLLKIQ